MEAPTPLSDLHWILLKGPGASVIFSKHLQVTSPYLSPTHSSKAGLVRAPKELKQPQDVALFWDRATRPGDSTRTGRGDRSVHALDIKMSQSTNRSIPKNMHKTDSCMKEIAY